MRAAAFVIFRVTNVSPRRGDSWLNKIPLQAKTPDDYVIATGETHTVKEMLELAFDRLQLDWKKHVKIDQKYYRPTEVDLLIGDASKAKKELGWEPKVRFHELIAMMVDADLTAEKEKLDGTRKKS